MDIKQVNPQFNLSVGKDYTEFETIINVFPQDGKLYTVYKATKDGFKNTQIRIVELKQSAEG